MSTIAPPSRNRAMDNTLLGVLELFKAKLKQEWEDMLPARVIAYDRATNRAQVQPLIVMVNTLNQQIPRAQIASIPVLQIGGGGFVISLPIKTGDLGWIKANDRDITFFLKNYAQSAPNTQRRHKFSDAVFIPDSFMKDVVINAEDEDNLVIQNLDGTVRIAIWDDKVKITAPSVIIDTPETTCTGNLIVNGDINIDGMATVTGDILAEADVIVNNDLNVINTATINGIEFALHVHGGVQSGGSNTGVPV